METDDRILIIDRLQQTSRQVFIEVAKQLCAGDSESDIAGYIRKEFAKLGITEFWYDVPIIILIGPERLLDGSKADYSIKKSPSKNSRLQPGSVLYVDLHPKDSKTQQWGDWNTMAVFKPRTGIDDEQVEFLKEMREIHRNGIAKLSANMTGADVLDYFLEVYGARGIEPLLAETESDIGHTIHAGPKLESHRKFLSSSNQEPIGGNIYAVEPGGLRSKQKGGDILVGRFEECVYIPKAGVPTLLGDGRLVPLVI